LCLLLFVVTVVARQHHVGLGANFILPSFISSHLGRSHDLEKRVLEEDLLLSVDCVDGQKLAGLGVSTEEFFQFALMHQKGEHLYVTS
jgi:hypothetical protein